MSHDQRVEHVLIDRKLLLSHVFENFGRSFDVTLLAVARDQPLVRDTIRFDSLRLQIGKEFRRRKRVLIVQVDPEQGIEVGNIHRHVQVIERFPDFLHQSRSHLGQFLRD